MSNLQMKKITKQIGKTHCGLASIANCTNYTEHELHNKIDFKELPKGLTIDELYSFLKDIKESDNSIGSIEKITIEAFYFVLTFQYKAFVKNFSKFVISTH